MICFVTDGAGFDQWARASGSSHVKRLPMVRPGFERAGRASAPTPDEVPYDPSFFGSDLFAWLGMQRASGPGVPELRKVRPKGLHKSELRKVRLNVLDVPGREAQGFARFA